MNPTEVPSLIVADRDIDTLYEKGYLGQVLDTLEKNPIWPNQYFVVRSEINPKKSALVRWDGETFRSLQGRKSQSLEGITPKDSKQAAFQDSLLQEGILLSVGLGAAGTGKTTIAMSYALHRFITEGKSIVLTKAATFVGSAKAFGPVPGDVQEKYAPFLASYTIVLEKILGNRAGHFLQKMQDKGHLKFLPIEYVRGCTFEDCTFIIDEAQNLTWHETNSVVSRIGEGSKAILLGDLNQIDTRESKETSGLSQLCGSTAFLSSEITSVVTLKTQYRSKIAELVINVDEELREKNGKGKSSQKDTSRA